MIDNVDGFLNDVLKITPQIGGGFSCIFGNPTVGNMHCHKCCGERRMNVRLLYSSEAFDYNFIEANENYLVKAKSKLLSSVWETKCTQCDTLSTIVFYNNNEQVNMAIISNGNSGITTPNTPDSVKYYLDQAYRARSIGANSACMAMYRAALDQILYEQGYQKGMLGNKLNKLEEDKKNGDAKKWIKDLDIAYLTYLNKLGSASIHPNDGNIEKQMILDNELLELVDIVFIMLLEKIYEQPKQEEIWLQTLKEKQESFNY